MHVSHDAVFICCCIECFDWNTSLYCLQDLLRVKELPRRALLCCANQAWIDFLSCSILDKFSLHYLSLNYVRIHSQTFHECPSHLHMVVLNIEQFFNQVGKGTYFAVFCPVTLGLASVPPEPDLSQPSLGIARDIKPSLPLEHNNNWEI